MPLYKASRCLESGQCLADWTYVMNADNLHGILDRQPIAAGRVHAALAATRPIVTQPIEMKRLQFCG